MLRFFALEKAVRDGCGLPYGKRRDRFRQKPPFLLQRSFIYDILYSIIVLAK
ncbi:Uncharacterised protein [uncultured Ruminococcus sp.]|nr:Uncharacterised protein [uncultured Ruminococcus sp.]